LIVNDPADDVEAYFFNARNIRAMVGVSKIARRYCRTPDRVARGHWLAESQQSSKGGEF
jgi:hypothetical protein